MFTQLFKHLMPFILAGFTNQIHTIFNKDVSLIKKTSFTEGLVYIKTSFPNHPLNDAIKTLEFETGDFNEQYHVIQSLKKHQQTIGAGSEQEIKDAFFVSAMMFLPMYSKMYFAPAASMIHTDALGYHQQTLINYEAKTGRLKIMDRNKDAQGTIHFSTDNIKEVWQKYEVNAEQYSIQKTTETATINGYPCTKLIYTFKGTTRGLPATNYIINTQPEKVTAWYTNALPHSINMIYPLYFELDKAILKFEVEYDKRGKNKMLVETTKIESKPIQENWMHLDDVAPVVNFKEKNTEATMIVMQVMMAAVSLLSK